MCGTSKWLSPNIANICKTCYSEISQHAIPKYPKDWVGDMCGTNRLLIPNILKNIFKIVLKNIPKNISKYPKD